MKKGKHVITEYKLDIFDIQNFNKEEKIIKTAKGDIKADLVLKNARIVNVLSEEIYEGDVAISDGVIAGVGNDYHGVEEIDVKGAYVSPSFIDGHVHLESSCLQSLQKWLSHQVPQPLWQTRMRFQT